MNSAYLRFQGVKLSKLADLSRKPSGAARLVGSQKLESEGAANILCKNKNTEMKDSGAESPRRRVLGAFRKAVLPISTITLVIFTTLCFTSYNISDSVLQSFNLIPGGECNIFQGNWVVNPVKVSDAANGRWVYKEYNFTLLSFWSPHIVKAKHVNPLSLSPDSPMNLYTDEADRVWANEVANADVVIFSAGQWFFRPFFYYKNGQIAGCYRCNETTITKRSHYFGYGLAFRTAFKTLLDHEKFKGLVILRTFSPAHFENGKWSSGGNCVRTRPFTKREMKLEGYTLEMYLTQVREFMAAKREGSKKGVRFRLLNTTESMVLRPDGHPNHYGHWAHENKTTADCVHWCVPGPIDTWNEFLLQVLKMETPEYI
nr:protein trichome birefringence-like 19 [Ipomoea batatas]